MSETNSADHQMVVRRSVRCTVQRFDKRRGAWASPVSLRQASWALARARMEAPHAVDAAMVEEQLLAGETLESTRYRYTLDRGE